MPIRFTIITSTYNVGNLLARTATSIREQICRNIQWIVVDGASIDNTIDVARTNSDVISILISEPDRGIYDAWNKALPLIDGDWVSFLGAGDTLHSPNTLALAAEYLANINPNVTVAYGRVVMIDRLGDGLSRVHEGAWTGLDRPWILARPNLPHQAGVFHRSTLLKSGYRYDPRLKIVADTEVLMRELIAGRGHELPLVVTNFDNTGVSSAQSNRLRMVIEYVRINWKVGIFFQRPFYQVGMIVANLIRHALLTTGILKR